LHAPSGTSAFLDRQLNDVVALEENLARSGFLNMHERVTRGGLSTARFSDQTQGFPGIYLERDVINSMDVTRYSANEGASMNRKILLEISDFEKGSIPRGCRLGAIYTV
tara:strand:- start:4618 stop:4944 length:327 start_codon:yes stop_codon:yes gene_type:complete